MAPRYSIRDLHSVLALVEHSCQDRILSAAVRLISINRRIRVRVSHQRQDRAQLTGGVHTSARSRPLWMSISPFDFGLRDDPKEWFARALLVHLSHVLN